MSTVRLTEAQARAMHLPLAARRKLTRQPSEGEETFAAQLRLAGLPDPEREYRFDPSRRWRFDFVFLDRKLAVEIEGGTWANGAHTRGTGYAEDLVKYNAAALAGWTVLRFTTAMVASGVALDTVERALTREED